MKLNQDDLIVKTYLYSKYFNVNGKFSAAFTSEEIYEHFKKEDSDNDKDKKYKYDKYYIDCILDNLINNKVIKKIEDSKDGSESYQIIKDIPLLSSFNAFQNKLDEFQKNNKGKRLYFRGEEGYYPFSIPSIYRNVNHGLEKQSNRFYSDLLVQLGKLSVFNQPLSTQLARFQHYQAPTRLIDITANPLAALFFALEKKDENINRKIYFYAVDPQNIKYQDGHTVNVEVATNLLPQKNVVRNFLKSIRKFKNYRVPEIYPNERFENDCDNEELKGSVKKFMEELNLKDKLSEQMNHPNKIFDDLNSAHFVEFVRESDRMKNQQGAFILPKYLTGYESSSEEPYKKLQDSINKAVTQSVDEDGNPSGIKCFTILGKDVAKMKQDLNTMGINSGSIYPDIEHYSKFLVERYQHENEENE